jgi:hypothetical protein
MTITIEPKHIIRNLLLTIIVLMAMVGGGLGFHFYWPTAITVDGHRVNRAQLIDWVISRELQRK